MSLSGKLVVGSVHHTQLYVVSRIYRVFSVEYTQTRIVYSLQSISLFHFVMQL